MVKCKTYIPGTVGNPKEEPILVYIAGKVSNGGNKLTQEEFELVRLKFKRSEDHLRKEGFITINPTQLIEDPNTSWGDAMGVCIPALEKCHAIYLQKDWKESSGARIEFEVAQERNKIIMFESVI